MTDVSGIVATGADWLSLVLIIASFLVVAYLAYRVKAIRSLQFEMFVVLLIITVSEIPKILSNIGIIDISNIETVGLIIHSTAMVFLAGFIGLRVAKYLK